MKPTLTRLASTKLLRILMAIVAVLQLAACSKTVEWEEEVPLNTGDTIWVKRTATYVRSSAYANPLKPSWRIESETLVFEWAGQKYKWEGDANLMLLAIDPERRPALVANASSGFSWGDRHDYKCTKPYYVQFVPRQPDDWFWPHSIERWLYGVEANLMSHRTAPDEMLRQISRTQRERVDLDMLSRNPETRKIVSDYMPDYCKGKV
jgi:hypothetical protein